MKHTEYEIQCQIATYLDYHKKHPLYCATLGGVRLSIGQAIKAKRQGYRKGIPDLIVYEPNKNFKALCLEVKAPGGRPSPEQKDWKELLEIKGYCHHYAYSFDEAKKVIDEYLGGI